MFHVFMSKLQLCLYIYMYILHLFLCVYIVSAHDIRASRIY